jgi:hypothetical protein
VGLETPGHYPHDTGASTNFLHDPLEWVVGADLLPMNVGKRVVGKGLGHAPASGSGRRRPRGSFFWEDNRASASIPTRGRGGKPSLRGGDGRGVGLTGLRVQPRLAVGDVSARRAADPSREEESDAAPNRSDRQTRVSPLGKTRRRGATVILIVVRLSP